ncbi:MAG: hypothetical protein AAF648_07775 [Pseudomonadota bacterium]
MSESFRLVFQGEVAADQHVAVVRKRLAKLLKANDKTLDALFSGEAVVLRKAIDAAGAAKFQAAFKQVGARLRVQPLNAAVPKPVDAESAKSAERAAGEETPATTDDPASRLRLLPVGSDLLEVHEQLPPAAQAVAVDHLTLAELGARLGPVVDMMADTERFLASARAFELAEVGATIGAAASTDAAPVAAPTFDLAEPGAVIGAESTDASRPPVEAPDFDLAEAGSVLAKVTESAAPPPAPSTDHIELAEESPQS